jgi:hypothetical protein
VKRRVSSWLVACALLLFVAATSVRAWHVHDPLAANKSDSAHCEFCLGLDRAPAPPSSPPVLLPATFSITVALFIALPSAIQVASYPGYHARGPPGSFQHV